MKEYKKPELFVMYLDCADVLTESFDGTIVEPGDDWGE